MRIIYYQLIFLSVLLLSPLASYADCFADGFTLRKSITIQSSQVPSTQTNFPVVLSVTDTDFTSEVSATCDNFRFDNASGTELPYEVEMCKGGAGNDYVLWFKADSIDDADVFYICYGHPSITNNDDPTSVWDGNFSLVMHMNGGVLDSTSNGNNGTDSGTADGTGKLGQGRVFTDNDYINMGNKAAWKWEGRNGTLEIWFSTSGFTDVNGSLFFMLNGSTSGWATFLSRDTNQISLQAIAATEDLNASTTATNYKDGAWHYYTAFFVDSTSTGSERIAASQIATDTWTGALQDFNSNMYIGGNTTAASFVGTLDEARISDTIRTDDWLTATYNNMNAPGSFYSLGSEESASTRRIWTPQ